MTCPRSHSPESAELQSEAKACSLKSPTHHTPFHLGPLSRSEPGSVRGFVLEGTCLALVNHKGLGLPQSYISP
jgi:hypothetical protein